MEPNVEEFFSGPYNTRPSVHASPHFSSKISTTLIILKLCSNCSKYFFARKNEIRGQRLHREIWCHNLEMLSKRN